MTALPSIQVTKKLVKQTGIQTAIRRISASICLGVLSYFLAGCAHSNRSVTAPLTSPALVSTQPPSSEEVFEEEIEPDHYANHPAVNTFIDSMVARYDFNQQALQAIFAKVDYSATSVRLVTPSATTAARNWQRYRTPYANPRYIEAGVEFWRANETTLQRAAAEFGVPPEIIVGIIGVETQFGRQMGNFRVIDVLTTLALDYPLVRSPAYRAARQKLFRQNLADFLLWTRSNHLDPLSVKGSYAGAIGFPQFMPTSILRYAVSYDDQPTIDLRASAADAIGSVANYLKLYGWEAGRPVLWDIATDTGSQHIAAAAADGLAEPHLPLSQLLKAGLLLNEPSLELSPELGTSLTVVDLPTPDQPTQYKLGLKNFYVLTRYNKSFFYATAVYQLGQQVKQALARASIVNAAAKR